MSPEGQYRSFQEPLPSDAKKKFPLATSVTVCIIMGAIFGALLIGIASWDGHSPEEKMDVQTITEDAYFELRGDFLPEREIFTVSLTKDGKIAFALNDDISSRYVYYSWWLLDRDHVSSDSTFMYLKHTGEKVEKAEPVLYYLSQKPGEYEVRVDCYADSDGDRVYGAKYSGMVSYIGSVEREYNWRYKGENYAAKVTFGYDEYRFYKEMKPYGRDVVRYTNTVSFVTYLDPAVTGLAESLREAYGGTKDMTGQDFASFVLGFVQICFDYPPYSNLMEADMYVYGKDEYFAYPLETIFYGMGDCEDTSILCAALFKALGYDAAVLVVPGHALAAVGLSGYTPEPYSESRFEIISQEIKGVTYYACETTVDAYQGIGLVGTSGYEDKPYSWYVNKRGYGFFVV